MKIAILSDIHGNWPALQAVAHHIEAWQPDMTLVAGDIVNGAARNRDCWRFVRERQQQDGWQVIRGNHEEYVIEWANPDLPRCGPQFELSRLSHWTYRQLNGDVADLAALPDRFGWRAPDESTLLLLHASALGHRDGIYRQMTDDELRPKIVPYPAVFVTAHTHVPFIRWLDSTLVVNVGSVGAPCDGDCRAGYGRLTWSIQRSWQAEIVRVDYDRAQTARDFVETGFLDEVGPFAEMALVELHLALDLKARWAKTYRRRVLAGELTVAESIQSILASCRSSRFSLSQDADHADLR